MARRILLLIAMTFLATSLAANAQVVKFENRTNNLISVIAVTGDGACPDKPQPVRSAFTLNPGEVREVRVLGKEQQVCWAASTHPDVKQFPMHCGVANVAASVVLSKDSRLCDAKPVRGSSQLKRDVRVAPGASRSTVEVSIGSWNDPLTPPQTATRCIKEAWGHWPWCDEWHTCSEWATDCRFMRVEAFLIVTTPDPNVTPEQLKAIVDHCLQQAAVAAALSGVAAAIVSGGAAAIAAAEEAFRNVLISCIAGAFTVDVRFDTRGHWTNWGSCT